MFAARAGCCCIGLSAVRMAGRVGRDGFGVACTVGGALVDTRGKDAFAHSPGSSCLEGGVGQCLGAWGGAGVPGPLVLRARVRVTSLEPPKPYPKPAQGLCKRPHVCHLVSITNRWVCRPPHGVVTGAVS